MVSYSSYRFCLYLFGLMFLCHCAFCSVTVRFYQMKKSMWTESINGKVLTELSSRATKYCTDNSASCSGKTSFNSTDVVIDDIMDSGNYLNVSVSMPLLPDSIVTTIIVKSRTALASITNYYIVRVSDQTFSPPPPTKLNSIIIPISMVIVLALIIATCVVHRISHKQEIDMIMQHNQRDGPNSSSTFSVKDYGKTEPAPKNGTTNGGVGTIKDKQHFSASTKNLGESQRLRQSPLPPNTEAGGESSVRARSAASSKDSVTAHIEAELAAAQITTF